MSGDWYSRMVKDITPTTIQNELYVLHFYDKMNSNLLER